ncbi:MAG TPA: hypothetical protein VIG80_07405 [Bacillaceae bacterium]
MNHAIVLGARQTVGFEICSQLLDLGCLVHAFDHREWQEELHENRWMMIGRNAHLQYSYMEEVWNVLQQIEHAFYCFIPLADYYSRENTKLQEAMLSFLDEIERREWGDKCPLVFLNPPVISREHSTFHMEVEKRIAALKSKRIKVLEFFLPAENEQGLCRGGSCLRNFVYDLVLRMEEGETEHG